MPAPKINKCGSCRKFMNGCSKRKTQASCDKPACPAYSKREIKDFMLPPNRWMF